MGKLFEVVAMGIAVWAFVSVVGAKVPAVARLFEKEVSTRDTIALIELKEGMRNLKKEEKVIKEREDLFDSVEEIGVGQIKVDPDNLSLSSTKDEDQKKDPRRGWGEPVNTLRQILEKRTKEVPSPALENTATEIVVVEKPTSPPPVVKKRSFYDIYKASKPTDFIAPPTVLVRNPSPAPRPVVATSHVQHLVQTPVLPEVMVEKKRKWQNPFPISKMFFWKSRVQVGIVENARPAVNSQGVPYGRNHFRKETDIRVDLYRQGNNKNISRPYNPATDY